MSGGWKCGIGSRNVPLSHPHSMSDRRSALMSMANPLKCQVNTLACEDTTTFVSVDQSIRPFPRRHPLRSPLIAAVTCGAFRAPTRLSFIVRGCCGCLIVFFAFRKSSVIVRNHRRDGCCCGRCWYLVVLAAHRLQIRHVPALPASSRGSLSVEKCAVALTQASHVVDWSVKLV